ncbi:MAG TPA: DMT family transporter, partial [Deltaproteobacteria bacterium]|nr:DMT family transporter [Deltaproteobacteria bacterium]
MAISKIQVAAAILIQYLAPVLVAVFAMAFWHERASFVKIAALSLSVTGCYLVAGGYDMDLLSMNRPGILWALASAVGFAASTLLGERSMHRHNPWTSLTYALVFSSISLNLVHRPLAIIGQSLGATVWAAIVYIVIFGTLVPFGLYLVAIDTIRSTRTIITSTLEPIAAAFLAFILLGESLSFLQAGGGLMV